MHERETSSPSRASSFPWHWPALPSSGVGGIHAAKPPRDLSGRGIPAPFSARSKGGCTMKLPIYQVDAFTDALFRGNPAAVCPLEEWLPDTLMQQIAMENNLSETA